MAKPTRYIDPKKLPKHQQWYFDHFESLHEWLLNGHSVKSAVWLGRLYTVLGWTVGLVFKICLMAIVLLWNMRNLDWRNGLNPLVWGDDWAPLKSEWEREYPRTSRWTQDKYGNYYSRVLKYYNPPRAVLAFFLAWGIADGITLIDAHWDFLDTLYYVGPFLLMGLMVVYAIAAFNLFRRWLNSPRRPEPKFTRL